MSIKHTSLLLATTGVLAAGGGGGALLASADASAPPNGAAKGTIDVTITRPSGQTVKRPSHQLTCAVINGNYVLRGSGHRNGRQGAAVLTVPHYTGAGSYSATLRVAARGPFRSFARTVTIPVTMTDKGGSASVTRTLPGIVHPSLKGKTVTVSAAWSCTP
jgi:hypothetical protein